MKAGTVAALVRGLVLAAATSACNMEPLKSDDLYGVRGAELSGTVSSRCSGEALAARVTIASRSTCSSSAKGYFRLVDLPTGGPQTLAAARSGWKPFSTALTIDPGFNVVHIVLEPLEGCGGPTPPDAPCMCTEPQCQ